MDFRLVIISMSINLDFKCTMLHISKQCLLILQTTNALWTVHTTLYITLYSNKRRLTMMRRPTSSEVLINRHIETADHWPLMGSGSTL